MFEAIDLGHLIPTKETNAGKADKDKRRGADCLQSDELASLVDRLCSVQRDMVDLQRVFDSLAGEFKARATHEIIEAVANGRAVMNLRADGEEGSCYLSVRANSRDAAPEAADNLAREFGRYVYNVLDHKETVKVKNPRGLMAAAKRAGLDVTPYVETKTVAKPQKQWPERLAMAGLPPDVVRGIFDLLLSPGYALNGESIAYAPQLTVDPKGDA